MDVDAAREFADAWVTAWNAHDLDAVLSHFSPDAVFTSPVAAQLLPETAGALRGRDAIRAYWQVGLERIPELHFTVEAVYAGVDTVVVQYRNHTGALVCEVLHLGDDGLVDRGAGTYQATDAAGASGASE